MKHIEVVVTAILGICMLSFLAFTLWATTHSNNAVSNSDYTVNITVDKCEKIPQALSNATRRVVEKGFIVNKTRVDYNVFGETYSITCGGVEEATLLKLEK